MESYKTTLIDLLLVEELKQQNSFATALRLHMDMDLAYLEYLRAMTTSVNDNSNQLIINCFQGIDLRYSTSHQVPNNQTDDDCHEQQYYNRGL